MPILSKTKAILKKVLLKRTLHWQVIITLVAFAALAIPSYFFAKGMVRDYIVQNSNNMLESIQLKIDTELRGPETTLDAFAEVTRSRILQGIDANGMQQFMVGFNRDLMLYGNEGANLSDVYGVFNTFGTEPVFIHGREWMPPTGYDPANRPWYKSAVAAGVKRSLSQFYLDISRGEHVLGISKCIMDGNGRQLAVVGLQVPIAPIGRLITEMSLKKGMYGMLLTQDLIVLSHTESSFIGKSVPDPALPFSIFHDSFKNGEDIFERPIISFDNKPSLAFFRKASNGSYFGVVTPENTYYRNITLMGYFLFGMSLITSAFLIYILIRIDAARNRATRLTKTLNKISTMLLAQSWETFQDAMDAAGKLLAEIAEVGRFSILANTIEGDALYMSQIYRWEKESGGTTKINKNFAHVAYKQIAPEWEYMLKEGKSMSGPVRLMPEREAALLSSLGTRSAFLTPIYINDAPWGFALFEDHNSERYFDNDLAETMQSASFLFANIIIRTEMEDKLEVERNFNKKLIDSAPVGINIWDENQNLIISNDAIQSIFCCTKQYYSENFDKFSPEYQPDGVKSATKVKELQNNALKGGGLIVSEWMHCSAEGEPIPCEITMTSLNYNNKPVVVVYIYDLRNLKKMEAALHGAEQTQVLIDATPLSCTLLDKDGNVLTCNKSAVEFFKLSKKDDIRLILTDLVPEYQPDGRNSRESAIEDLNKTYNFGHAFIPDWVHKSMDGELLPCEVTLVRVEYNGEYVIAGYARDLRAEKASEAKAREADERAQLMLEQTPLAISLWDKDFKIFDCNPEALRITGVSSKKEYSERLIELAQAYQPNGMKSLDLIQNALVQAMKTGYSRAECTMNHAVTGEPIPFDVTVARVKHKGEDTLISYGLDLRERNAAIAKMREADEKTKIMFDAMPLCSGFWNSDGEIVDCNDEVVKLFDLKDKQEYIDRFDDLSPKYQPDGSPSAEAAAAVVAKAFEDGYCHLEWMMQKLNGEPVPIELFLIRLKLHGDYVVVAYFRDLREIKASMEKIREADERAMLMLEQTPLVVMLWDKDANILDCNQEAVRATGLSSKKEYVERLFELTPDLPNGMKAQEAAQTAIAYCLEAGYCKIEWALHHAVTGELIPFDVTIAKVKYKGEDAVISYAQDVRERNAAIEKMREADDRARVMIEQAPLVVMLWDKDANILDCNQEAVGILGLSSKEEYMERFFEIAPDQLNGMTSQEAAKMLISKVFETGYERVEWVLNHPATGEPIPFDSTIARIKYKGEYIAMSYGQDVRERNAALAKMREADERAQLMIENTPLTVMVWDKDIQILDCNEEAVKTFGLSNKQDYIDRFFSLAPEYQPNGMTSQEMIEKEITKVFQTGSTNFEWTHHHGVTGEDIPFQIRWTRVNFKGEVVAVSYAQDVRERNAALAQMREADERAQLMLEQAPFIMMLWDENMQILDCNQEALRVLGLSSKKDYIERFFELNPEYQPNGMTTLDAAQGAVAKTIETGYDRIEWSMNHSITGELIPFDVTVARVKYKGQYAVISYGVDLRERNATLAKMREADERSRIMLDSTPLSCSLIDINYNFIDCNKEAERLFCVSNKQEYVDGFFEFCPECQPDGEKSQTKMFRFFKQAFELGYAKFEWQHMIKGEKVPCDVTLVRVKHYNDYIIAGYTHDLRMLRGAEASAKEAEERAQLMIEFAPYACCMYDKNGDLIDCNQETVKMFGIPNKEFYFKRASELSPEYQPCGILSTSKSDGNGTLALKNGYNRFEWMFKKMNGEPLPTEVTLVRVHYNGDNAVAGYIRDLTEQKASEQLTKLVMEKTSTLTAVFDSTPDMIFCKDINLLYTECNKAMENHFNVHKSDIIGKQQAEILKTPPDITEQLVAVDKMVIAKNQTIVSEEMINSADGRTMQFEMIRSPLIQNGTITGLVGIARDITQRKEMMELEKRHAEAEAANRTKSSFLATMSHEIRTPMNAILGITEIQMQNEGLPNDTKNALNIIYNSGYSLLSIINDLLDLSKIEAGKLELVNGRYEMASLINDTINLNTARIGSKPIEFKLAIDEDLPFELIGDELRVKQILNNLLSNAFKYTDKGEVRLSFTAKTNGDDGEDKPTVTLTVTVSDTGQGMTEEQIHSMFDAYSRFNMKANRFVEGTGLGMNIVQQLIKQMDGDISVNSEPGKGTEVTVHVVQGYAGPAKLGSELAENLTGFRITGISKLKKAQIVREHMPYGKILVVDDMETNLYVAKGFLMPYGLAIETTLSGQEAIAKIERGKVYDIVFMDHMMPVMDGIETVKIIREKGYTLPIVALTANAVAGQADIFMANGFDGFISKPIDIRELNASLNKFVRDRQSPEVIEAARAAQRATIVKGDSSNVSQTDPELAKIFIRDAEKAMTVLQEYENRGSYEDDDLQMYIVNVHALKSALANIGETKLSALASELEQAGRQSDAAFLSDKTPAFLGGLQEVLNKLNSIGTEEDGNDGISDEDVAHLRKMLLVIKSACAEYDIVTARAALKDLKLKPWARYYAEFLDNITDYLLNSDFEKAEEICNAYLSDE